MVKNKVANSEIDPNPILLPYSASPPSMTFEYTHLNIVPLPYPFPCIVQQPHS